MQYTDLLEKRRHNLASEELSKQDIGEKIRHDYQTEDLERSSQALSKAIQESKNRIDIYKIESDRQIANVKNALEQYKLDIEKWAKENSLKIDAAKANAAISKTNREIDKLVADTAKTVADTALTKTKEREIVTKLNGSIQGLAGQLATAVLGENPVDPNSGLVATLVNDYKLTSAIGWKPTGINVMNALIDIQHGKDPAREWMKRRQLAVDPTLEYTLDDGTGHSRTHSNVNARKFK
jgi:hypothetical protein